MLKNNADEGMFLESIVNCVSKELKKVLHFEVPKYSVGLDKAVEEFEKIAFESSHNVQIVGIVGMGGCGKTTLAKELYNQNFSCFDKCSFLFEVRGASEKKNLHKKQKNLLKDLHSMTFSFDNVEDGKRILARHLRSLRLFIILDDVDNTDQLDALLPRIDSLGRGSLILVTSRDLGVLKSWGISSIYTMKGLNPGHANQLLCWHAFLQPYPQEGFEDLIKMFVKVCEGLPLSLKVFGRQLYRKPRDYWESQLNKISRLLPKDIKDILKVSYDALDDEEKEMFLDTACFFIGKEKSLAITVWDGLGLSGVHSWETLLNKCMVELDHKNRIRMHDHLRDLGKEIATTHLPHRLWLPEQIANIKRELQEGVVIRGITAEFTVPCRSSFQTPFEPCMELVRSYCRKFRRFTPPSLELKLLNVRGNYFAEEFATQVRGLVWLRWVDFQQKSLPSWISLKNLRVLELHSAEKLRELWRDNADPALELRELHITGGISFLIFPRSIGFLKHLKKISLSGSKDLRSADVPVGGLPEEFCRLQSLEHLHLDRCTSIKSLPTRFGHLTNMRHLDLSFCSELRMLPLSFKQLIHLEYISLRSCHKLTFTSHILENMTKLKILNLSGCRGLQEFPRITNQGSLRELYVVDTGLTELPGNIGQLSKLQVLKIGSNWLTSLPTSIGNLSYLTYFEIVDCEKLKYLPESIGDLHLLRHLYIRTGLKSLPKALEQLNNLQSIHLENTHVSRISISQQCCPCLDTFSFISNHQLIEIETLPMSVSEIMLLDCIMLKSISGICGVVNLQSLWIERCEKLDELPSFAELVSLKEFISRRNTMTMEGLEPCSSLERLEAYTKWKVAGIQSLKHMERLRTLELSAYNISAIEPCLHTIEKWPSQTIICARTDGDVDFIVKSFEFQSLPSVDESFLGRKAGNIVRLKSGQRHSCNAAAMACFVITSFCEDALSFSLRTENSYRSMELEKGKWVLIGVFTDASSLMADDYILEIARWSVDKADVEVGGTLVLGEREKVVEGFKKFVSDLGKIE